MLLNYSFGENEPENISNVYDLNGNKISASTADSMISRLYDAENRVYEKEQDTYGVITYQYDITAGLPSGEVAEIATHPDNTVVKKVFDKNNRLSKVYYNNTLEATYEYYISGQTKSLTYANGVKISYLYQKDGQLKEMVTAKGSTEIYNFTYEYDKSKNLIKKDENGEKSYAYDAKNRLTRETEADEVKNIYEYDDRDNRIKQYTDDFSIFDAQTDTTYSYDKLNRLTALVSGSDTQTYSYNAENYRIRKNSTFYAYEYDKPIAEYVLSSTGTPEITAFNLFGTNLISRIMGGQKYYYLYNSHGDVIALTDTNGDVVSTYEYDSWGAITAKTGDISNPFRYAGYVYD